MTSRPNSKRDRGFEKLAARLDLIHRQPDAGAANATVTRFHGANSATIRRMYILHYAPDFNEAAEHALGQDLADLFTDAWNAAHGTQRPDPLLSTGAVAARLGVDRRTVTNWCESGRIAATRTAGGHWRIRESALDGIG